VLVRRGDPEVVRNVADNKSAKLSDDGFTALVKRAEAAAKPQTQAEVQRVLDKVSREFQTPARDYTEVRRMVLAMHEGASSARRS
jgi:hypothetical protein